MFFILQQRTAARVILVLMVVVVAKYMYLLDVKLEDARTVAIRLDRGWGMPMLRNLTAAEGDDLHNLKPFV